MADDECLVSDKVLGFRMKEVLDIIRATASRKGWDIIKNEGGQGSCRLTVRFSGRSAWCRFEVTEVEPRPLGGRFKMPRTRLIVWAGGTDEEQMEELKGVLHIAFLRAGG